MYEMGTITVNIPDNVEKDFRRRVASLRGVGKGVLGSAVAEALTEWGDKRTDIEFARELLRKGFPMGGVTYTNREELYEDRF